MEIDNCGFLLMEFGVAISKSTVSSFTFEFSTSVLSSQSGTPVLEYGFPMAAYCVLLVLRLRICDL